MALFSSVVLAGQVKHRHQRPALLCSKLISEPCPSQRRFFALSSWVRLANRCSILRDPAQVNQLHRLYIVVAQAAGIAGFIATAQQIV